MAAVTVNLNLKELDRLMVKIGASSRADLIQKALGFLALVEEKKSREGSVDIGAGESAIKVFLY